MSFNHLSSRNLTSEYQTRTEVEDCSNDFGHCTKRDSRHDNRILAGLTIFAFIMLQSWRKSRKEIRLLKQCTEEIKKSRTRTENQLRVYGSLVRIEQSRTDELTAQLKRTLEDLRRRTASCRTFSITLTNLRKSQAQLEQELKKRYQEYNDLNEVLAQTKKQLFRSMMEQRNLHMQLCREQRAVQSLENEKKILITEIRELNTEHRKVEENYCKQLKDKDVEIIEAKKLLGKCQAALIDVQKNCSIHEKTQKCFVNMENELRLSRLHVNGLQKSALCSIYQRLGMFWARLIEYRRNTLNYFHILTYYLLPAMPSAPAKYKYTLN